MIDLKTAKRVVYLHEAVKGVRAALVAIDGPGRKIKSGKLTIVTAEGDGWSNNREQSFSLEDEDARRVAFAAIKRHYEQRLAALIRELHQLNAEVP